MDYERYVLITCEHASKTIPVEYQSQLQSKDWEPHQLYDIGAKNLAESLQKALKVPLFCGTYSRLLVDLNRGENHKYISLLAKNSDKLLCEEWIKKHHRPFRKTVKQELEKRFPCIHLSVHSFSRVLDGKRRATDIGILYDPHSKSEKQFAAALLHELKKSDFKSHANKPYKGISDGHTKELRKLYGETKYAGIEIEVCNDILVNDYNKITYLLIDALTKTLNREIFNLS